MPENSVIVLTASQLKDLASDIVRKTLAAVKEEQAKVEPIAYVKGLRGIAGLFNVSLTTAQAYKNTFLAPAIEQRGRVFRTNVPMAQQLFAEHNSALAK